MIVIVCGGRYYADDIGVARELDRVHAETPIALLVNGDASGADRLACLWAMKNGIRVHLFAAQWEKHGRAAGPLRNQRMLDEAKPDLVLAFPGGSGTFDMCTRARLVGVPVTVIA
jgi:hypothetical protein